MIRNRVAAHGWLLIALVVALSSSGTAQATGAASSAAQWPGVEEALGRPGAMQPAGVIRFAFPRSDMRVTVAGVALRPALALGSWLAFQRMGGKVGRGEALVMGDLVLAEDEVAPVIAALHRGGIEQSALHNHLLQESPRVMYLHVMATGDPVRLATSLHAALAASRTPIDRPGTAPAPPDVFDLDTAAIAHALGATGRVNGGVYQVSLPRRARITDHGMAIPPSMGVATALNFQPIGEGRAAITGDFVMTAPEVNAVIRALREHDIDVTALHSHMLTESPRLLFMHFWATGDAPTLARGLGAALDHMAVTRAPVVASAAPHAGS
jgi:hypothetical protein